MFTKEKCRENQIVVINRFDKAKMAWENQNFFLNKYLNLHGCPLLYATTEDYKSLQFNDRIVVEMSKILNFRVEPVKFADAKTFEDMVLNRECDLFDASDLDFWWKNRFRDSFWSSTANNRENFIAIRCYNLVIDSVHSGYNFLAESKSSPWYPVDFEICVSETESDRQRWIFWTFFSAVLKLEHQEKPLQDSFLMYRALQLDLRHPPMETLEDLSENQFKQYLMQADIPQANLSVEDVKDSYYG